MMSFAERTGLISERPQQRYLWTDAFAVCNFLALADSSDTESRDRYADLALRLVDNVHHTLGKHRADDSRVGWLNGSSDVHPTLGGLRIGKELAERRAGDPFDEQLEWERDGQYFHYLTRWMHALDQVSRATEQPHFNLWARELAEVAYAKFSYQTGRSDLRMRWKMSIDLSRPLVASMGQHDPLDGFVTCCQLQATASRFANRGGPNLDREAAGFASMLKQDNWVTADPLGIGGLLTDAGRVAQLVGKNTLANDDLLHELLAAALMSLSHYAQHTGLDESAASRLAFRELGLSIGLHTIDVIARDLQAGSSLFSHAFKLTRLLNALRLYVPLAPIIESFWLDAESQQAPSWSAHRNINQVMLAASLLPEGYLVI
jgi:hypothetical protein